MNSRTLTISLLVAITLAVLWTSGKLQGILQAAFGK